MTLFNLPLWQAWLLMGLACYILSSLALLRLICDAEVLRKASADKTTPGHGEAWAATALMYLGLVLAGPLGIVVLARRKTWTGSPILYLGDGEDSTSLSNTLSEWAVAKAPDGRFLKEDGSLTVAVRRARILTPAEIRREWPGLKAVPLSSILSIRSDYL